MAIMERIPRPAQGFAGRLAAGVERAIELVSPRLALDRKVMRAAAEELVNGYKGARKSRVRADIPGGGSADFQTTQDRWEAIEIARRLERDSVIAESLLSRSVENIVGPGYTLRANTNSESWNKRVERLWAEWADGPCDARGMSDLGELTRMKCRARLRDGDGGTVLLADGATQQVESDQIVSPSRSRVARLNMVDGVELDPRGRPVAFHVISMPDPVLASVRFGNSTARVPASEFVFTAKRRRDNQTRGYPSLARVAWLIEQIDGNIEAVTVASRMAACVGLVIKRKNRMSGLDEDSDGRRRLKLQPGSALEIGHGDEVTPITPSQPGTNWPDYLATLCRLVGLEFGLPLELAFLDVSRANYTNLRAANLQARKTWTIEQAALKRWLSSIYRWKVLNWMRAGLLPVRGDALAHGWVCPPWIWVDPEREFNAAMALVDAGLSSKTREAMGRGDDLEDIVAERKREIEGFAAAGIPEVRSKLTRDPAGAASAPGGDGGDDDAESEDSGDDAESEDSGDDADEGSA